MKITLNLTNNEAYELANLCEKTTFGKQVKMAILKAETKELKQAIKLEKEVNDVQNLMVNNE